MYDVSAHISGWRKSLEVPQSILLTSYKDGVPQETIKVHKNPSPKFQRVLEETKKKTNTIIHQLVDYYF